MFLTWGLVTATLNLYGIFTCLGSLLTAFTVFSKGPVTPEVTHSGLVHTHHCLVGETEAHRE